MASNSKGKKNWLLDKLKQLMTKVDLPLKKEFFVHRNCQHRQIDGFFEKVVALVQKVLSDRSSIGQKLIESTLMLY